MDAGRLTSALKLWAGVFLLLNVNGLGAEPPVTQQQFKDLQRQNQLLQEQLNKQQLLIEELSRKLEPSPQAPEKPINTWLNALSGKIHFSGEGGVAFFDSERDGAFPNSEFRIDEAKLFVEAEIFKDIYFFSELNLVTREDEDFRLQAGELYVDFENISRWWNREGQLNLRVGRFDIPFGEEYLTRDAIDNPLISHSLMDFWGIDEGIELYGRFGPVQYVAAVQNGGHPALRDYDSDKSIAFRVGYDPVKWLHVSGSAMRTGALAVEGDELSEMWFGNAFFRSLGSPETTRFEANLLEGDVQVTLPRGYVKGAGGYIKYDDNDPLGNNQREVYFYYFEALHDLTRKAYAAARWSHILAPDGFPIVGNGSWGRYFFGQLTEETWRLSLGIGYRFTPNLLLKTEYSFDHGEVVGGGERNNENMFAAELAFRF